MNIVQQFKYNNSNDYELIKRIRKQDSLEPVYTLLDNYS